MFNCLLSCCIWVIAAQTWGCYSPCVLVYRVQQWPLTFSAAFIPEVNFPFILFIDFPASSSIKSLKHQTKPNCCEMIHGLMEITSNQKAIWKGKDIRLCTYSLLQMQYEWCYWIAFPPLLDAFNQHCYICFARHILEYFTSQYLYLISEILCSMFTKGSFCKSGGPIPQCKTLWCWFTCYIFPWLQLPLSDWWVLGWDCE